LAPSEYKGEPYLALNFGAEITSLIGIVAAIWVNVYLSWALWPNRGEPVIFAPEDLGAWFIQRVVGGSRACQLSAVVTRSEHPMRRFCWFSPCIMKCNVFTIDTPWPGTPQVPT
jgi:hypothetical protein